MAREVHVQTNLIGSWPNSRRGDTIGTLERTSWVYVTLLWLVNMAASINEASVFRNFVDARTVHVRVMKRSLFRKVFGTL